MAAYSWSASESERKRGVSDDSNRQSRRTHLQQSYERVKRASQYMIQVSSETFNADSRASGSRSQTILCEIPSIPLVFPAPTTRLPLVLRRLPDSRPGCRIVLGELLPCDGCDRVTAGVDLVLRGKRSACIRDQGRGRTVTLKIFRMFCGVTGSVRFTHKPSRYSASEHQWSPGRDVFNTLCRVAESASRGTRS